MKTTRQVIEALQEINPDDIPIGTVAIKDLDDHSFYRLIRHHNEKVDTILSSFPSSYVDLRRKVEKFKIPSRRDFEAKLDDPEQRKLISRPFRRGSLACYRQWVCRQEPVNSIFKSKFFRKFDYSIDFDSYARHSTTFGASGSGKSVAIYTQIMSLIKDPSPKTVLCLEPHGDLVGALARNRFFRPGGGNSERLIHIDPEIATSNNAYPSLNPLDISGKKYTPEQIEKYATQVVSGFVSMLGEGNELSLQMKTLLLPSMIILLYRENSTFEDLLRLMDDDRNKDLLAIGNTLPFKNHRTFFLHQFRKTKFKRTKDSISVKLLSLLSSSLFTKLICQKKSTIRLDELVDHGDKILTISTSKGILGSGVCSSVGKLICSSILGTCFNRAERSESERVPIYLFIDECQNYVAEEVISTAIAESRKYGLSLNFAQQVIGQGMSQKLTKLLLGNSAIKMIGKSGTASINVMSREMGLENSPEFFQGLGTGLFVVQKGSTPPCKVQIRSDYAGKDSWMSPAEYAALEKEMVRKYYTPFNQGQEETEILTSEIKFNPEIEKIAPPTPVEPGLGHVPEGLL